VCFAVTETAGVNSKQVSFFFSCRFMLAVIGFFMFLHLYAQRISMSLAIVCMLNQTALDELESAQTLNATTLAGNQSNETELTVNVTEYSASESQCSHWMTDRTAVHKVLGIAVFCEIAIYARRNTSI